MTIYVGKVEAKYIGALHMRNLYKMMHDWVVEKEYAHTRHDYDFPETNYWESRHSPTGSEIWVWWRCHFAPEENKFYRRTLRMDLHAVRLKNVEIIQNNKKYSVQWAEFKVIIHGLLETDVGKKWQKNPFMNFFYKIFVERIMWRDLMKRKKEVLIDMYDLEGQVKDFYNTKHFMPVENKSYWAERGMTELAPQRE